MADYGGSSNVSTATIPGRRSVNRTHRSGALMIAGLAIAVLVNGCAQVQSSFGYPSAAGFDRADYREYVIPKLTQPGIESGTELPFQLDLTFDADQTPRLAYAEQGNLGYGPIADGYDNWYDHVPVDGGEWDYPLDGWNVDHMVIWRVTDRIWYPQKQALLANADGRDRPWMWLASTLGDAKASEAGSVEAYNQRFASIVQQAKAVERELAEIRNRQEDASFYADRAQRVVDSMMRELRRQAQSEISVRLADGSTNLAGHVVDNLDESIFSVRVRYKGEIPNELKRPLTASLPEPDWVPASTLEEVAEKIEQVRTELDNAPENLEAARNAREQRLDQFRNRLDARDFEADISLNQSALEGLSVDVERPDVQMSRNGLVANSPMVIDIQDIDLVHHFDAVGVEPRSAIVRRGPSEDAARLGTVSGGEIGFVVEDRSGYTHVYERSGNAVGWIQSSAVVSPDEARRAALERAISERRSDGSPTNDALRALVVKQIARANANTPDWGGLVGAISLESFEVIACDRAIGESGYRCDVRGRIQTNNAGIEAVQQIITGAAGEGGVVPYQRQIRAVYSRDGHWVIAESEALR